MREQLLNDLVALLEKSKDTLLMDRVSSPCGCGDLQKRFRCPEAFLINQILEKLKEN